MSLNNEIKIEYRGKHVFDLAMQLAFTSEYEKDLLKEVVGYKIHNNTMFLFDYKSNSNDKDSKMPLVEFPYKMKLPEVIPFVWGWLENTNPNYDEPDTDGSVEKGFCVTTDGTDWRGGSEFYHSFIAIKPIWIVYGK